MNKSIIKKRMEAAAIDLLIVGFPVILAMIIISSLLPKGVIANFIVPAVGLSIIFVGFVFRDFWGKGKKYMGITVISVHNGKEASKKQKILRNITLLIYPLELIYLKSYGFRLGDSLAGTDVAFTTEMR